MAQAAFFYQQKVDPGWYLAPPAPPSLAWMQTSAEIVAPRRATPPSVRVDATWFAPPAVLSFVSTPQPALPGRHVPVPLSQRTSTVGFLSPPVNLPWLQTGAPFLPLHRGEGSVGATVDWFLDPPIDLAWMQTGSPFLALLTGHPSASASSSTFLAPPLDTNWLQIGGTFLPRLHGEPSVRAFPASFLAPPIDLSWLQSGGIFLSRLSGGESGVVVSDWFLDPPLDVSWLSGVVVLPLYFPAALSGSQLVAPPFLLDPLAIPFMPLESGLPLVRTIFPASVAASPVETITPLAPDVSWLQTGETPGLLPFRVASAQASAATFLALAAPPDLTWMQTRGNMGSRHGPLVSTQGSTATFLALVAPPDLAWMQTGGTVQARVLQVQTTTTSIEALVVPETPLLGTSRFKPLWRPRRGR